MVKKISLGLLLLVAAGGVLCAEAFRFAYTKGEKYRIVSRVHEGVTINGRFSHDADILNKISVEVTDTRGDAGYNVVTFQTSERAYGSQRTYQWSEDYTSEFWRDGRGAYTIDPSYFMPVVRDVPLFPEGDVQPGQSWVAQGSETHDLRNSFGIPQPFSFPVTANYAYTGNETRNGVACAVITIGYEIFHAVVPPQGTTGMYPVRIAGYSHQRYWWDLANRRPVYYTEDFDFVFSFNTGDEVEYAGKADGELVEAQPLDRSRVAGEIQQEIQKQGIPDVTVKPTDQGVTITLENINFPPNSDSLLPSEQDKIQRIAEILKKYPDRDIAVTGHTARAPGYTEEDYQNLSDQRARAVANYLLSLGARTAEQITARGMGARVPIGDNSTDEGRRKNRRVEITILEN
ncbi:MAG: OmpA family protein [Spirochaetia bacterium]|jgi:outer membrane protein OmpA-like peptidoglycan-associated protein